MQTKVTELLDGEGISYRLLPHSSEVHTCEEAAAERGAPLDEMIKCILLTDKKDYFCLACLPADQGLDPKLVREAVGSRRLQFASNEDIERVLGYQAGAVAPVALLTNVPVVFDYGIRDKVKVNMSSGDPSAGLELNSADLIRLVNPQFYNITK